MAAAIVEYVFAIVVSLLFVALGFLGLSLRWARTEGLKPEQSALVAFWRRDVDLGTFLLVFPLTGWGFGVWGLLSAAGLLTDGVRGCIVALMAVVIVRLWTARRRFERVLSPDQAKPLLKPLRAALLWWVLIVGWEALGLAQRAMAGS